MNTYELRTKLKTTATVIAIVAIVGVVILIEALQNNAKSTTATTTTSSSPTASTTSPTTGTGSSTGSASSSNGSSTATTTSGTYKDGTYTADASYYVPHGTEDIKVTLTVANGVVTDSSIVNSESDHDSQRYQEEFADEYKSYVVGKNLADIKLSYVAGASDTTDGFNDAVSQIQSQAQA